MYSLAFDTASSCCSAALFNDNHCLSTFVREMEFGQAETLMPAIDGLLKGEGLSFSELGLITVCTGPGSFTGVRSGIAAARSFGLACPKLEVMGVTAFEAYVRTLAWTPEEIAPQNAVVIETKREDFYCQIFDGRLQPAGEPFAAVRDDIIAALRGSKVSFIGDGVERFLSSKTGLSLHAIVSCNHVDIKDLALCGLDRFNKKLHNYPKPLYLRAPDVCVK